jgi:twitching motility two-component system response regulator PilH
MALKGFGLGRLFQRNTVVEVPAHGGEVESSAEQGRLRPNPGTTVLIVDDSKTIQLVLGRLLSRQGYEILSAYDGESAVTLTREHHPALILMDVVMPGMNGFQATREIRKDPDPKVSAIPVLIMSGNAQPTEAFWSAKIKASGFLPKPFDDDELFAYIERLLYPNVSTG